MSEQALEEPIDEGEDLRTALESAFDGEVAEMENPDPELLPEDIQEVAPLDDSPDPITGETADAPKTIDDVAPPEEGTAPASAAPASWKPQAREHWASIPEHVQQEILRRETDTSNLLREGAQSRQTADQFNQVSNQFAAQLAAEGATPISAFQGFMEMAATMQSGNHAAKAALIHRFINNYGVDINMLDSMLVGDQPTEQQQQQDQIPGWARPLLDHQQQQQQQLHNQQRQMTQDVTNETNTFISSKEFGKDVRPTMATLFEIAARSGKTMTLDDAYEQACQMTPDVRTVMDARKNAKTVRGARRAAVSASDSPMGASPTNPPGTLRDALEAAWDNNL